MNSSGSRVGQVLALGAAQTVAWASSNYLPAILAAPIAVDLGISRATVFGAFSMALVLTGLAGPVVGRIIDRGYGRATLVGSNLVHIVGLLMLSGASSPLAMFVSWAVLGAGMAMGLYDAAFATLVRLHGEAARTPITGITLIGGFASTIGWPLTAYVADAEGWRTACLAWAAIHLFIALPLNLWCIPSAAPRQSADMNASGSASAKTEGAPEYAPSGDQTAAPRGAFPLLALFFAATAFVTSAMGAHLPGLLAATGVSAASALAAAALMGPAQVAARLSEFLAMRRYQFHPMLTARIACALQPAGVAVLLLLGGVPLAFLALAAPFAYAVLYGAGNGMLTIARGTLPLAIFGPQGYGFRQGWLSVIARAMQAAAPFAFGWMLEALGVRWSLVISAAASLVALGALLALRTGSDHHRTL